MICDIHKTFYTTECRECIHAKVRAEETEKRSLAKRKAAMEKPRKIYATPAKQSISRNPEDWNNTFLCSDGTKVTQSKINRALDKAYRWSAYTEEGFCLGCGKQAQGHAHIISKARCKKIGKTELIWDKGNFFEACNACNLAIENPKGKEWRYLLNVDWCLLFIKQHDPQLYTKFEIALIDQSRETI